MIRPYVSWVATARNDDHGGNLLGRMQLFADGLAAQCERHRLRAELVLVEWNPPAERPELARALRWPATPWCPVRIVRVPPELHGRFEHASALPLFQMIAKNVGIRRAHGQFVVATNVDVLFSDALVRTLAAGRLRKDRMYRATRYDVPAEVPPELPIERQLDHCARNVIRICARDGTRVLRTGERHEIYHRPTWKGRVREAFSELRLVGTRTRERLHTNACGDFTLLAKDRWLELRGYAELPIFSMHLDSLFCHAAHFGGARELVLPEEARVYHLEHGVGSGWTPEGQQALWDRIDRDRVPRLSRELEHWLAVLMRREQAPVIFNGPDWGLADHALEEHRLGPTR